jgi:putative ABC transport system ATP-binding protein
MIHVDSVSKTFCTKISDVRAVENASMEVTRGEFVLILGRSGSGKSTLLGMIAGLLHPTSGTVRFEGLDISTLPDDKLAELRAEKIGFVFQFSGLIPTITARENVLLPTLFCRAGPGRPGRAADLLKKMGLSDRADAYPHTLSSGEMKRVAIARALINSPSLLIADEPTGDLDADTEYEIMELFRQLNREGTTIIMVTHNPDLACYATRTYGMNRGILVNNSMFGPKEKNQGSHLEPDRQDLPCMRR